MKKILAVIVFALCLCFAAGCAGGGTKPSQQTPAGGIMVSVYDPEVNLLGEFTFHNPEGNTIDVARFAKVGHHFEGIFDMNQGVMLFAANGNQSPTVMLDKDFTAVVKYSPVIYQLTFDAGEGKLENPAEYTKKLSYGENVDLFPQTVLEGMELAGWLTKGYFRGYILPGKAQFADIAGKIETSGSVSKTIGNGNTGVVGAVVSGSSIYNYLIGKDYQEAILFDGYLLFEELGLFEADYWSVNGEYGLHLIAYPRA